MEQTFNIVINEQDALLIVSAVGTYQGRGRQKAKWLENKYIPRLKERLVSTPPISAEEQADIQRKIDYCAESIEKYHKLNEKCEHLIDRIKALTGITTQKYQKTFE